VSEPADTSRTSRRAHPKGDLIRAFVRGIGQTLITAGVVMLLFVVYTLYITNIFTARDQSRLNDDLADRWTTQAPAVPGQPAALPLEPPTPGLGQAFARLYIPAIGLGTGKPLAVVQGVGTADLKKGPGHLAGSALPGEVGNLVISGHRTTYGAPFNRLDEVDAGDEIIVETATTWFTYRMTTREIVKPSAYEVTYPVPHRRDATPTNRLITLTTCNPKYSAKTRLIIVGELGQVLRKSTGQRPPALEGRD
jgi:sortase A